jgi:hypothetical protein
VELLITSQKDTQRVSAGVELLPIREILTQRNALGFGKRRRRDRRKIECLDNALEAHLLVGAIAERFVLGVSAAAESDLRAAGKPKYLAILVHDFEISFDSYGTVVANRNLCRCHSILREKTQYFGTEGSTSSDHARIPPFRFEIFRKPALRRNSTACAERLPLLQ